MELTGNSTATGNEFYDINTQENQNNHIYLHSSTFNSNRYIVLLTIQITMLLFRRVGLL